MRVLLLALLCVVGLTVVCARVKRCTKKSDCRQHCKCECLGNKGGSLYYCDAPTPAEQRRRQKDWDQAGRGLERSDIDFGEIVDNLPNDGPFGSGLSGILDALGGANLGEIDLGTKKGRCHCIMKKTGEKCDNDCD